MSRVREWMILLTSSIVTLISLLAVLGDRKDPDEEWERHEKWVVSVASISIAFSVFGGLVSMMPPAEAHKMESPMISIVVGFWAAGLPAILDPDHGLAVNSANGIANANLYFFSWGAMITSIVLLGSWYRQLNGDDASPTALQWVLLAAFSYVVMGTSSGEYNDMKCGRESMTDLAQCRRTRFAVYLGLCSGLISMAMAHLKQAPMHCQGVVGILHAAAWGCGVSYITFGDGPGKTMGNIYFATWLSFFLSINITTTAVKEAMGDALQAAANNNSEGGDGADADAGDEEAAEKKVEKAGSDEEEAIAEQAKADD